MKDSVNRAEEVGGRDGVLALMGEGFGFWDEPDWAGAGERWRDRLAHGPVAITSISRRRDAPLTGVRRLLSGRSSELLLWHATGVYPRVQGREELSAVHQRVVCGGQGEAGRFGSGFWG